MKNNTEKTLGMIWAVVMAVILVISVSILILGRTGLHTVNDSQYALIERYSRLEAVRERLSEEYFEPVDDDTLILGAIRGMTASLNDPYTFYYTPEEMEQENRDDAGLYHGIGILVQQNAEGMIEVLHIYPDTPAEAAGLEAGDCIIAVDGVAVNTEDGRSYNESVEMIRGVDDTSVTLTVRRDSNIQEITVTRSQVNIDYATCEVLDGDIGYISITQFSGNARAHFLEGLKSFEEQGVKGLIIDVRSNPGGLLTDVVDMADALLPEGVIVYIQNRAGERINYASDEACYDVPLVVLVNEKSASASEILAASIQTFERGTILGTTTYGKGIVQTLYTFEEDHAGMQLTTASYYTGDGVSIHGKGVEPDIVLPFEGEAIPAVPDPEHDNQLAAAIELLKGE